MRPLSLGRLSLSGSGGGSGGGAPAPINERFGALTAAGAGGVPVSGTSISSGDASGHWQIVGGYLSPSATGDTANLNAGPYSLVLNNGQTVALAIDANAYDVRTNAEWDTVIAIAAATLSGRTIYVRQDSYRGGSTLTSGVDGTAAKLRRADYGGLVIQGRVPAFTPGTGTAAPTAASDRVTFNKFFLRGTRNVTFRHLATTAAAEVKFQLTGEAANNLFGITIDQCHVSGAVGDPNGDYSVSTNYPNRNIDLISCTGAANNASGTITVSRNWVEWGGTNIGLRVDRDASSVCNVTGNYVRYWYDDGIGISKTTPSSAAWYDCVTTITDNICTNNVGKSTDSDAPHCDAIRLISLYTVLADWTIHVSRNRIFVGDSRGNLHLQAVLASDYKSASGDSGYFFTGTAIGNVICTDNSVGISIENAKAFVALNNTVVTSNIASGVNTETLRLGSGSTYSTTTGTHRVERNIAEAYGLGGTPTLVDNITLGKGGLIIPYANVFDAGAGDYPYPDTVTELMAWFARKTGGPADLAGGPPDAGAIGATAVTFATTVPGSDGANIVS